MLAAGITDINPGLAIWTVVTFIVLLIVLRRFAWGPILKVAAEREQSIRDAIEQAKREREQAERVIAEAKAEAEKTKRESAEAFRRAQADLEASRAEHMQKAAAEAEKLKASAFKEIAEAKSKALSEIRDVAADLAIEAAKKLVTVSLDEHKQKQLVEDYLKQLPGAPGKH
jgi:F-type H+-transporting ATPase subunit b